METTGLWTSLSLELWIKMARKWFEKTSPDFKQILWVFLKEGCFVNVYLINRQALLGVVVAIAKETIEIKAKYPEPYIVPIDKIVAVQRAGLPVPPGPAR